MKNKDTLKQAQLEIAQKITAAAKTGDSAAFEDGLRALFANIEENILAQAAAARDAADATVLAQRGVRQLTARERDFYANLIDAMKEAAAGGGNAMMALTGVEKTFPETIISAVMDDIRHDHPLLDAIDIVNTTGLTRFIINTGMNDRATWGAIDAEITKEITSGFDEIDLGQNKLSAFMPIPNGILDLGPSWLDTYIRACLSEALALGYEYAVVTGTGKDMPIGMDRSVADDVTVTAGVYPQKTLVAVTDFTPASYGALISKLAKTRNGHPRAVTGLILVTNPEDYFKVILPGTTLLNPSGGYINNVMPFPTRIIQSVAVTRGEAILGIGKNYWLGVAGNRGIQFSDEYKFLEDNRYYKIVAYGNGRPKDDNSFLRLNIANLEPTYLTVKTIAVETE